MLLGIGSKGSAALANSGAAARLRAEIEDLEDDKKLMDWVQAAEVYVSPHGNPSSSGGKWHVHHIERRRTYNGATMREAIANAILDREGWVPAYLLEERNPGQEFLEGMLATEAIERGLI
jgi:hypothetical protein